MATMETFVHGRLYEMPLADLQPDPNQPRKYIDPGPSMDSLRPSNSKAWYPQSFVDQ